jgi:ferredoxin
MTERVLFVDPSLCEGHGKCYRVAGDLLRPKDDHGHAEVIVDAIPEDDVDRIARGDAAINRCPEEALSWASAKDEQR